jgi:ribosome-associated protein
MPTIKVKIKQYPIRLGQFLKLADISSDGIEAKLLIHDGQIKVNDQVETRRGRQLNPGDAVTVDDRCFTCV